MATLSPSLQHWYKVAVTLNALDGSGTTTVYFTNRVAVGVAATAITHPLLRDINGINFTLGQDGTAVQSQGSIVIADSFGSFGEERRFSDMFERYTACDQNVTISDSTSAISSTAPTYTERWSGYIRSVSKDADTVTLTVDGNVTLVQYLCVVINETIFPNAPAKSLGKKLPVIFGSRDSGFSL